MLSYVKDCLIENKIKLIHGVDYSTVAIIK